MLSPTTIQPTASISASYSEPHGQVWACPCCRVTLRLVTTAARQGACPACGSFIEAPESATSATSAPPATHQRNAFALAGAILFFGLAATLTPGFLSAFSRSSAPGAAAHLARPAPPAPAFLQTSLDRFLQAPDWPAKRPLVLNAYRLESAAAGYYNGRDPEEIAATDFHPCALPGLAGLDGVAALRADRPGRRPVLAILRQAGDTWLLDWEIFTQTYDDALTSFLTTPSFAHRTLRCRLARTFSPNRGEPGLAVEMSDPLDQGQRLTFHLAMGTPLMQTLAQGLTGTSPREATVTACWARPELEGEWTPLLQDLVCWGWQGLHTPAAALPAPPPPPSGPARPSSPPALALQE